jgi:hypothetical protein
VRFVVEEQLGRVSICHCRMCQKAFGNAFAPLATAQGLRWTHGAPAYYRSSNKVRRGFCRDCGTPLSYEPDAGLPEIAVCALDDPSLAPPTVQIGTESRLAWTAAIPDLPPRSDQEEQEALAFQSGLVSHQHPDRD